MLQPPPKPTPEELAARKAAERKRKRDEAALNIFCALLTNHGGQSAKGWNEISKNDLLQEAFSLANGFINKTESP